VVRVTWSPARRPGLLGLSGLLAALGVECVDELVYGAQGAALPLIRGDLSLSWPQIGLLTAAPLLIGGLLDIPIGLLAPAGPRRWRVTLAGGVAFAATLVLAAVAASFWVLLAALILLYPASGAYVGLTQATLMDADPGRRAPLMARWTLAGSVGSVAGPVLLIAVITAGGTWRASFGVLAVAAVAGLVWLARCPALAAAPPGAGDLGDEDDAAPLRQAVRALRRAEVRRWLLLLEVSDLLGDVLTGFLALYLVTVAGASPALAALGVAVRLGAGLAGDVLVIWLLERVSGRWLLRVSAMVALAAYPAFLMAGGLAVKLVILAVLSVATACWYPVIQAGLFDSLPGRSGVAVSLTSAAGLFGGLGPLAVGLLAERAGLGWAIAGLIVAPVVVLAAPAAHADQGGTGTGPASSGPG